MPNSSVLERNAPPLVSHDVALPNQKPQDSTLDGPWLSLLIGSRTPHQGPFYAAALGTNRSSMQVRVHSSCPQTLMRGLLMSSWVAGSVPYGVRQSFILLLVSVWPPTAKLVGPQCCIPILWSASSSKCFSELPRPRMQLKHESWLWSYRHTVAICQRFGEIAMDLRLHPGAGHHTLCAAGPSVHVGLVVADNSAFLPRVAHRSS